MQVNPGPVQQEAVSRSQQIVNMEQPPKGDMPDSLLNTASRYGAERNLAIDNVLLQSSHGGPDYSAIQQIQRNYGLAPHQEPPQVPAQPRHYPGKPVVGSEEWYKVRKDNHKQVERRRRETINKGIDELSKVVPDCDKHKGQILSRAVEYIKRLKENEQKYMEKMTLEKVLAEQAITELSNTNKALKNELTQAWKEVEHWKRQAESKLE